MAVATGWTTPFGQPLPGGGAYFTADGGATWQPSMNDNGQQMPAMTYYSFGNDPASST